MSEPRFIFIIGAARSGTKFIRSLFVDVPDTGVVPYDVNYIWRYGNQLLDHDCLPEHCAKLRIRRFVHSNLVRLAAGVSRNPSVIVEKTVSNCLRVPYVDKLFPESKFIHIIRDGRDVVESVARVQKTDVNDVAKWKKLLEMPISCLPYALWFALDRASSSSNIWGPRYETMEVDLRENDLSIVAARQWLQCVSAAKISLSQIEPGRVMEVRYEELVSDDSVVENIAQFASVSTDLMLENYRKRLSVGNVGKGHSHYNENTNLIKELESPLLDLGYL
ncbi:MAG: sulfotransferase [Pseudomonadales bacterium]|nr:sulfotransferase [Pseudomonadales bacterium]